MDHPAGTTSRTTIGVRNLCAGIFLGAFSFSISNVLHAQTVISATSTVTITACVDDGSGSCNPVTPPTTTPPSNGGGGGGGGAGSAVDLSAGSDSVIFKGLAYPGSIISLLKNGVVAAEVPASPDGTFQISLRGLNAGTYSFGILAEDSKRMKSTLDLYTVFLSTGVTTQVQGIFLPPTITTDKSEVKQGDPIILLGSAAPNAEVTLLVHSANQLTEKTKSDSSGAWLYKLDSLLLEQGQHEGKARTATSNDISLFSDALTFTVGTVNKIRTAVSASSNMRNSCDLNGDLRVNLLDFSIMAYWYKRAGFPVKLDLNNDGRIDLSDVSILAYCWTG
jgi:hypothetical protein